MMCIEQFEHGHHLPLSASGCPVLRVDCCLLLKKWRVKRLVGGFNYSEPEQCKRLLVHSRTQTGDHRQVLGTGQKDTALIKSP
jgi:hypothetical protein